jgi:hypothetical protein
VSKWIEDINRNLLNLAHVIKLEYIETDLKDAPAMVVVAHLVNGTKQQIIGHRLQKNEHDEYDIGDVEELVIKRIVEL